jgi:putative peptidoglycan lipid II flippase
MFKKTIQVSFLNLSGFVFQFLLNLFITTQFGIGLQLDLYNKAITIPSYLIVLLTSCVTYIFIPLYSKVNKQQKESAPAIINDYFIIVGAFAFIFMIIADINSEHILTIFNKKSTPEQLLAIQKIFLIYSPVIILSTLIEFLNTIFYSNNIFKLPLLWKIINPILIILLISSIERTSSNIASSYLIVFSIQFLVLFIFSNKKYFKFKLSISLDNFLKKNKSLFSLSAPLIFSIILTKTLPVFDVYFLSDFNNGVVSNVLLSQKLITTLSFVINSFFSVLFFAQISNFAADKNYDRLYEMLLIGIKSMFFISIPIIFFLLHNSEKIFYLLFAHGKFSTSDSVALTLSFKYFLFGLPAIAIGSIISYAIYSLQSLKIFYITSIIEVFVYVCTALLFKKTVGQNSIPLAFIINFAISDLILFLFLKNEISKYIKNIYLPNDFYKLIIATLSFIPYYFYSNSNKTLFDLLYFTLSLLLYILILIKLNFTPILYLYRKLFKNER